MHQHSRCVKSNKLQNVWTAKIWECVQDMAMKKWQHTTIECVKGHRCMNSEKCMLTLWNAWGCELCKDSAMRCWDNPLKRVPCQKDEGAKAKVISYLDELAMHQPSQKAWDKMVWPPPSSAPILPCQHEHVGYIQGCVVELGPTKPLPQQFNISHPSREFICFTRGLIF